jgi:predicted nucleic acid-binding protein
MATILVDANLLVYAHDPAVAEKQKSSIEILDHLHSTGIGCFSAQTLAEFFAATTRGKNPLLTAARAFQQVENLASSWVVLAVTRQVVIEAARGVRAHKFSYWDSQLWAAARLNQVPVIFTEDFNTGATIEGVRFVSPFSQGFQLAAWR